MDSVYLVPDYVKEYVEKYFAFSNYTEKKYDYFLVYKSSNVNNDYYEVCFFSNTAPDGFTDSVYRIYSNNVVFYNATYKIFLKPNEKTGLYTFVSGTSPSLMNGKKTYGNCTGYLSETFYTNYPFSTDTNVENIDYQPYFLLVTCAIILVFFVLIFKRRR